ncbi:MAG: DUF4372 domain-containing protein [Kiritimatiellae bacterium]|nr:DUF4372 domain-containing protein [Kiritimatiellia bacterium]
MKTNNNKATPRVYHTLRQIVQRIPRWLIEKTANAHGVDARKFSATSHFVMLIFGYLSRASCLTEICDDADLNKRKLSLVRNTTSGKRNTFSHTNRTRPAEVAETVYWETVRHLGEVSPGVLERRRRPVGVCHQIHDEPRFACCLVDSVFMHPDNAWMVYGRQNFRLRDEPVVEKETVLFPPEHL